eukprot:271342-Chlamydomonas_euryale.AAC.1
MARRKRTCHTATPSSRACCRCVRCGRKGGLNEAGSRWPARAAPQPGAHARAAGAGSVGYRWRGREGRGVVWGRNLRKSGMPGTLQHSSIPQYAGG